MTIIYYHKVYSVIVYIYIYINKPFIAKHDFVPEINLRENIRDEKYHKMFLKINFLTDERSQKKSRI